MHPRVRLDERIELIEGKERRTAPEIAPSGTPAPVGSDAALLGNDIASDSAPIIQRDSSYAAYRLPIDFFKLGTRREDGKRPHELIDEKREVHDGYIRGNHQKSEDGRRHGKIEGRVDDGADGKTGTPETWRHHVGVESPPSQFQRIERKTQNVRSEKGFSNQPSSIRRIKVRKARERVKVARGHAIIAKSGDAAKSLVHPSHPVSVC